MPPRRKGLRGVMTGRLARRLASKSHGNALLIMWLQIKESTKYLDFPSPRQQRIRVTVRYTH